MREIVIKRIREIVKETGIEFESNKDLEKMNDEVLFETYEILKTQQIATEFNDVVKNSKVSLFDKMKEFTLINGIKTIVDRSGVIPKIIYKM